MLSNARFHALTAKHRVIAGPIVSADLRKAGPWSGKYKKKLSHIQRAGQTFERRVNKILTTHCARDRIITSYTYAQWIEFTDAAGHGWAQPDWFVVVAPERRLIIGECKLTQTPVAWKQMAELYAPLLKAIFGITDITFVQCVKNLSIADGTECKLVWEPSAVFASAAQGEKHILWCVE